jgi:phosphoglycolate phosphatase-like HAD superfamily hydrolase
MGSTKQISVIFWDFDGVLMNSNPTRDFGFERVLHDFPKEQVEELLAFHRKNGGLSRYVKFRYFFEEVRGEKTNEGDIRLWAARFSEIMRELLVDSNLLIDETLEFVKANQGKFVMHITSGSDQEELRFLCQELKINDLFASIHGSPTPKTELIRSIIESARYDKSECVLIGDSRNDWQAAKENGITFIEYNCPEIAELGDHALKRAFFK